MERAMHALLECRVRSARVPPMHGQRGHPDPNGHLKTDRYAMLLSLEMETPLACE